MATNLITSGDIITVTGPTGGVSSGGVVVVRSGTSGMIAVVINDIAAAATGPAYIEGEFELTANAGTGKTFAVGDKLYWSSSVGLTKTTTGNTLAGTCTEAKSASATTGKVKLQGV
jgi:predicted RecA/RadA family phage recombinase